jgi:hypothetical protein
VRAAGIEVRLDVTEIQIEQSKSLGAGSQCEEFCLQVTLDDVSFVRDVKRTGNLNRERKRVATGSGPFAKLGHRPALDHLENGCGEAVAFPETRAILCLSSYMIRGVRRTSTAYTARSRGQTRCAWLSRRTRHLRRWKWNDFVPARGVMNESTSRVLLHKEMGRENGDKYRRLV